MSTSSKAAGASVLSLLAMAACGSAELRSEILPAGSNAYYLCNSMTLRLIDEHGIRQPMELPAGAGALRATTFDARRNAVALAYDGKIGLASGGAPPIWHDPPPFAVTALALRNGMCAMLGGDQLRIVDTETGAVLCDELAASELNEVVYAVPMTQTAYVAVGPFDDETWLQRFERADSAWRLSDESREVEIDDIHLAVAAGDELYLAGEYTGVAFDPSEAKPLRFVVVRVDLHSLESERVVSFQPGESTRITAIATSERHVALRMDDRSLRVFAKSTTAENARPASQRDFDTRLSLAPHSDAYIALFAGEGPLEITNLPR